MIYEVLGPLLRLAGNALSVSSQAPPDDAFLQRDLRRASLLVRRVATALPALFDSVAAENRVLEQALREASGALEQHGLASKVEVEATVEAPLERRRQLLRALDAVVITLHAAEGDWRRTALKNVRQRLAEAAEIQQRALAS
jgi:hypothetical protein